MKHLPITIFIHGTLPPTAALAASPVARFYRCPLGLTPLSDLPDSQIRDILHALSEAEPAQYTSHTTYAFGWPGALSSEARKEAGIHLAQVLQELHQHYLNDGYTPAYTLITHSHGGNVALQLAHHTIPSIQRLILLACPVQSETADAVTSEVFERIYAVHSHADMLQVLDPEGIRILLQDLEESGLSAVRTFLEQNDTLFSARHFQSERVHHIKVTYPYRQLLHIEFLLMPFTNKLPKLITYADGLPQGPEVTYVLET